MGNAEINFDTGAHEDFSLYPAATFMPRFFAAIIDGFIFNIVSLVGQKILVLIGISAQKPNVSVALVNLAFVIFAVMAVYIMPLYYNGQTLGKKTLGLKVINLDNTQDLTFGQACKRELWGKILSSIALFIGFLVVLTRKNRMAWHDQIAKTRVINLKATKTPGDPQ